MVSSFVDEIDKSRTAAPSSSAPAGEKERPMATSLLINVSAIPGLLWLIGTDDVGGTNHRPEFRFSSCS
jgi:hypothetical protein